MTQGLEPFELSLVPGRKRGQAGQEGREERRLRAKQGGGAVTAGQRAEMGKTAEGSRASCGLRTGGQAGGWTSKRHLVFI